MTLHLNNPTKKVTINLDFIKFFGYDYGLTTVYHDMKAKRKLLIKYLIDLFAPEDNRTLGILQVNDWFKKALQEVDDMITTDSSMSSVKIVLCQSYERFRKDYKLDDLELLANGILKRGFEFGR